MVLSLLGPLLLGTTGFYRRTHTYLDQDQVLTYDPAVGTYSVLQMIRGAQLRDGACPVFNPMPLRRGALPTYRTHTYLGDDRVLEVDPRSGDYRVLCFNRTVPCVDVGVAAAPSEFGDVVQMGTNPDFVDADVVVSLGQDEILIHSRTKAAYAIRMYDRNADLPAPRAYRMAQAYHVISPGEPEFGNAFPGLPVAAGFFKKPAPQSLMYAGKGLLLGYTAGGEARTTPDPLARLPSSAPPLTTPQRPFPSPSVSCPRPSSLAHPTPASLPPTMPVRHPASRICTRPRPRPPRPPTLPRNIDRARRLAAGPHWSMWSYDRTIEGSYSPPLRQTRAGIWSRNVSSSALNTTSQRELTYLGKDVVLDYEPGSCGYTVWPLLRGDQLPAQASPPAIDPLGQSGQPLDAGSFCLPPCSGTCAASSDSGSCGWCKAPVGGPSGGSGQSTSSTGPRGSSRPLTSGGPSTFGLPTYGSPAGSCFCSCSSWSWAGVGCPSQYKKPECSAHRTCSSCLDSPECSWCGTSEQCFERQAQSSQMCGEWHDLTCPMVPRGEAFNSNEKPCSPRGAFTNPWDLSFLQLLGAARADDC